MRKINEIFYSLQGEGYHSGVPSVFVRFSGCNKRCSFCDTDHFYGTSMSDEEIAESVSAFPCDWIVLTGGEPAMWIDAGFVSFLKETTGKKIAIETNGSLPVPAEIDWVTVSPKCGMPGAGDYEILVEHADELKVVDLNQPLDNYFKLGCVTEETRMYLQPCFVEDVELNRSHIISTVNRVLADPRWNLSAQLHRFLGIR